MTPITELSLRALIRGRRPLLIAALLLVPVLLALAYITSEAHPDGSKFAVQLIESLYLPVLVPLTALLFATSALGGEIEDGTLIYLTLRPVSRLTIITAKLIATVAVTVVLVEASIVLTYLVAAGGAFNARVIVAILIAGAAGSLAYCSTFLTIGLFLPRRGLIVGFVYVLAWEGTAAGLSSALATLSVRQYVVSTLHAGLGSSSLAGLQPSSTGGVASVVVLGGVILVSILIAVVRLKTMEQR